MVVNFMKNNIIIIQSNYYDYNLIIYLNNLIYYNNHHEIKMDLLILINVLNLVIL